MPWTIYRYILWDLLKLLVICAVVLVMVISFAAAIKPLSEGLLSAASLMKFVGYTAPTMLAFVLPFAGAFASTLVFLRLASDNEITAMSASGMSYTAILMPVFLLGLVMTMGLFYMSNFVIPGFYRAAAQTLQSDLMTVLVSRLDQKRPFDLKDYVIYADNAAQRALTPDELAAINSPVLPSQLIELTGVAVGRVDSVGRVRDDMTAQHATVLLFHGPNQSWINIGLNNVMQYDPLRGFLYTEKTVLGPIALPSPMEDNPEYLSWRQLRALRDHPERYSEVAELERKLADAVASEKLRQLLVSGLRRSAARAEASSASSDSSANSDAFVTLNSRESSQPEYLIQAPRVRRVGEQIRLHASAKRPVVVRKLVDGRPMRRFEAQSAIVSVQRASGDAQPGVLITLDRTKIFEPGKSEPTTERTSFALPRMMWPTDVLTGKMDRLGPFQMLELAGNPPYRRAASVRAAGIRLWKEIQKLGHRIKAHLHERAASAVACLLLIILGAVLSMMLKGHMPLVVYFWSFALAIITVIIIHTGTNLAGSLHFPLALGLSVLWVGNIILAVVVAVAYCRLARN